MRCVALWSSPRASGWRSLVSQQANLIHLIRERPTTQVEELLCGSTEDKAAWMAALMKEKNKVRVPRSAL